MRVAILTLLFASPAIAQDRFVERTPLPRTPVDHTMQRAGNPRQIAWWAQPGVGRKDAGGYVGGGSHKGNGLLVKGPVVVTGPVEDGTFGTDYVGLRMRMGRVFLAPSADPGHGPAVARNYRTDGPHVPDVFAWRPLRKAVLEKKEDLGKGEE
ncbi:MAG: hypothetical protein U0791_04890 [Gemmataceae bacterium]